ncbi:hypothetical protein EVAR_82323_1 [Eumeta japonica]|uniref:Uncharacterized protein n=1 Tax=Eumeta variegata TaxID=151549 RepID=A0A4C1U9W3_EUMVA|nr:hypothetical protein EVAR_82323_1 [Eumeta japonica]
MLILARNATKELKIGSLLCGVYVEWNTKGGTLSLGVVMHRSTLPDNASTRRARARAVKELLSAPSCRSIGILVEVRFPYILCSRQDHPLLPTASILHTGNRTL